MFQSVLSFPRAFLSRLGKLIVSLWRDRSIPVILLTLVLAFTYDVGSYFFRPDVSLLRKKAPNKTAMMVYQEHRAKEKGKHFRIRKTWIPLKHISPYLREAVVMSEDDRFWQHHGFDFDAMKEALKRDIIAGRFKYGASTITQQLAKNLYLGPSRSVMRKLKEAVLVWRLERNLSKWRILELYLNVVEWGKGIYGAEAAAQHYFGKSAEYLTPYEAAQLAVALPSPRRFSPAANSSYAQKQAEILYQEMLKRESERSGIISK